MREIREKMRKERLEAFFVLTKFNRQYLSGFTGSSGILTITKRGAELFVDDRYLIRARRESDLRVKPLTRLPADLSRKGRGKFGVEDRITLNEFAGLKKRMPGAKFKTTHNVVENLRAVKTPIEIGAIRKGARIIDNIFTGIIRGIKKFKTESDIALFIEQKAKALGAEKLAFDPIVASGPNSAAPHHNPGKSLISKNNFLLLDYGVVVGGMHSDFTRTLFIGRPQKRQERIYEAVLRAQEKGIGEIGGSGEIRGKRVDQTVRRSIAAAGYGKYFTHSSGHGVGLEIHELPNLSPGSGDALRPGMVVTIEPGIYIEKKGGVRIEDMVLLKDSGGEVLSKVPKDFKSMIIHV